MRALAPAQFLPQWVGAAHSAAGEVKDEVEDRHQHKVNEDPRAKALDHHGYGGMQLITKAASTVTATSSTVVPASLTCRTERLTAAQLVRVKQQDKAGHVDPHVDARIAAQQQKTGDHGDGQNARRPVGHVGSVALCPERRAQSGDRASPGPGSGDPAALAAATTSNTATAMPVPSMANEPGSRPSMV